MRGCQLCGARSWANLSDAAFEQLSGEIYRALPRAGFRYCDNCAAVAHESYLDDTVAESLPPAGFGPDPFAAGVQQMVQMFKPTSHPVTRTERLLAAMLSSDKFTFANPNSDNAHAHAVVGFIRALEAALDTSAVPAEEQWGAWIAADDTVRLRFASRLAFVEWLLHPLEVAAENGWYNTTADGARRCAQFITNRVRGNPNV